MSTEDTYIMEGLTEPASDCQVCQEYRAEIKRLRELVASPLTMLHGALEWCEEGMYTSALMIIDEWMEKNATPTEAPTDAVPLTDASFPDGEAYLAAKAIGVLESVDRLLDDLHFLLKDAGQEDLAATADGLNMFQAALHVELKKRLKAGDDS